MIPRFSPFFPSEGKRSLARLYYLCTILLIGFTWVGCGSAPVQETKLIEEPPIVEEIPQKKARSMPLPETGCCPINQTALGIVVLEKICFTKSETELVLSMKERKRVCILKEGTIFRDNNGKDYKLLKTKNVDLCPKRVSMVKTPFSVVFERLDDDTLTFDYKESYTAKHAHNPWGFENVDISSCGSAGE